MYEFLQERVENNMTRRVRSVAPETTVGDLYRLFAADDFDAYPVVRGDTPVGIVSKLDALNVFALSQDYILPRYKEGMASYAVYLLDFHLPYSLGEYWDWNIKC